MLSWGRIVSWNSEEIAAYTHYIKWRCRKDLCYVCMFVSFCFSLDLRKKTLLLFRSLPILSMIMTSGHCVQGWCLSCLSHAKSTSLATWAQHHESRGSGQCDGCLAPRRMGKEAVAEVIEVARDRGFRECSKAMFWGKPKLWANPSFERTIFFVLGKLGQKRTKGSGMPSMFLKCSEALQPSCFLQTNQQDPTRIDEQVCFCIPCFFPQPCFFFCVFFLRPPLTHRSSHGLTPPSGLMQPQLTPRLLGFAGLALEGESWFCLSFFVRELLVLLGVLLL